MGSSGRSSSGGVSYVLPDNAYSVLNPIYQGPAGAAGVGNATADTFAINAVLADVTSGTADTNGKQKKVHFPGGKHYRVNATVTWPNGVHMDGGPGSEAITSRPATIRWDGTAGGTMFDITAGASGRVNNTVISDLVFREGTTRPGKWWEMGDETISAGVDFGTRFERCHFYNADAPAGGGCLDIRFGPTNFWMDNFRMDGWTGAAIRVAVNNAASHVNFSNFTMDNTTLGGYPFWFDNGGMGSNKDVFASIRNGKIEINSALTPVKTVIRCSMDPASTSVMAHRLHLENVHIQPGGSAGTDWSYVKAERTDAVDTRYIYVKADSCKYLPGAGRLIDGVIDPPNWGTFTGSVPDWSYTPQGFGFASPGATGVFADHQTQVRFRDLFVGLGSMTDMAGSSAGRGVLKIHTALAAPTANPTGGFTIYVDPADNKLKCRGPSGTITTIGLP